ncbi:hypothetical protein [Streptomyces sp. ISL-94]|uniref:hypothetical protein n=1 Tax=Streptomyces sp. ISL-94 TaxID=2819190 RepID=UPI001BEA4476|nr:hypothetical protein [Streptomyces sp. ISL-94]MBT2482519.1 hypothetical protein [Streptomyces sp. ISL-94]
MPNQPKTPISRFRIDAELWSAFGEAVPAGTDRSDVLRRFVAYYCQRPGAELPERPPAGAWSTRTE